MQDNKMENNKGFSLIEILITLTVLGLIASLMLGYINYGDRTARNNASKVTSDFAMIESAFVNYNSDKGIYPTGLGDATFVPVYLFNPQAPSSFDLTYGSSGYNLGLRTGQVSPNNGYYLCSKLTASSATDPNWLTVTYIGQMLSAQKYFYNTSCPATTNMAAPAVATVIYPTIWLTRN